MCSEQNSAEVPCYAKNYAEWFRRFEDVGSQT